MWERTEDRFQRSMYRTLCQMSIIIEVGEIPEFTLVSMNKILSHISHFIDPLKSAHCHASVRSAPFIERKAQFWRIVPSIFQIALIVQYHTLTPRQVQTRSEMLSNVRFPLPILARDVICPMLLQYFPVRHQALHELIAITDFTPPRTRVRCPGGAGMPTTCN